MTNEELDAIKVKTRKVDEFIRNIDAAKDQRDKLAKAMRESPSQVLNLVIPLNINHHIYLQRGEDKIDFTALSKPEVIGKFVELLSAYEERTKTFLADL